MVSAVSEFMTVIPVRGGNAATALGLFRRHY